MTRQIELAPSKIRFMHDRINSRFKNGVLLSTTIQEIEQGTMSVYSLPKIRVVRRNGYYYAFDNRRLYVYRVLQYRGLLDKVKVNLAPLRKFQPERFTTRNNGRSVRLQSGLTLPHSEADSPPSSPEELSEDDDDDYYDLLAHQFDINLHIWDDDDEPDCNFGYDDSSDDYDDYLN